VLIVDEKVGSKAHLFILVGEGNDKTADASFSENGFELVEI
jgi:hypothetical protein